MACIVGEVFRRLSVARPTPRLQARVVELTHLIHASAAAKSVTPPAVLW